MKTVGIIGGIGPESTMEYYRQIIASYRLLKKDDSYPSIIIASIDLNKMRAMFEANQLEAVTDFLLGEVKKLARAGADFGVLAANTPHLVFDELARRSPLPLISIVETTCAAAKLLGLNPLGLIGTRFTMQGRFYQDVFARQGLGLAIPSEHEQTYIHDKYMAELIHGVILPETRARLLQIVGRLKDNHRIQGLILGGTELPLILREDSYDGVLFLDTTKIHVARIVAGLLS